MKTNSQKMPPPPPSSSRQQAPSSATMNARTTSTATRRRIIAATNRVRNKNKKRNGANNKVKKSLLFNTTTSSSYALLQRRRRQRTDALRLFCLGSIIAIGIVIFRYGFIMVHIVDLDDVEQRTKKYVRKEKQLMTKIQQQIMTKNRFAKYLKYHTCTEHNHSYTMLQAPSLIIAGGSYNSGTTAMSSLLLHHPSILSSQQDEGHFFDERYGAVLRKGRDEDGIIDVDELDCHVRRHYLQHAKFQHQIIERIKQQHEYKEDGDGDGDDRLVQWQRIRKQQEQQKQTLPYHAFEQSPSYSLYRHVPAAIHQTVPWTKILVLLRNPVDRLVSHYMDVVKRLQQQKNHTESGLEIPCLSSLRNNNNTNDRTTAAAACFNDVLSMEFNQIVNQYSSKSTGADYSSINKRSSSIIMNLTPPMVDVLGGSGSLTARRLGRRIKKRREEKRKNRQKKSPKLISLKDDHAFCKTSSRECFLQRGMYGVHLKYWLDHYQLVSITGTGVDETMLGDNETTTADSKKGLMMVLPYELFRAYPQQVYDNVLHFLNLPPFELHNGTLYEHLVDDDDINKDNNNNTEQQQRYDAARSFLSDFYRPYNERLVDILGNRWEGIWDDDNDDWKRRWLDEMQSSVVV